jgi:hypothetical protein
MSSVDPLLLRFIERLVCVLLGGMAIYLGYRLFRDVPQMTDSSGKVVLPWNISVAVTRVGPGVFFALFGVVAVGTSLVMPLRLSGADAMPRRGSEQVVYLSPPLAAEPSRRADARRLLEKEMNLLNSIPRDLRADLAQIDREDIEEGLARVKLRLLEPVWGTREEGFDEYERFATWIRQGTTGEPPPEMAAAAALFRTGITGERK